MENGSVTEGSCGALSPRCANRLDRNTSGIVAAGEIPWRAHRCFRRCSGIGRSTNITSASFTDRSGRLGTVDGWLLKDPRTNQVKILSRGPEGEAKRIVTRYEPLAVTERLTLLKR